jgi:hypothetical protein
MRSSPIPDLVDVGHVSAVGILASDAGTQMQRPGAEADAPTPTGTAERRQILDQPGGGNSLAIGSRDVVLDTPVDLDTEIWPDTVNNDHSNSMSSSMKFR